MILLQWLIHSPSVVLAFGWNFPRIALYKFPVQLSWNWCQIDDIIHGCH